MQREAAALCQRFGDKYRFSYACFFSFIPPIYPFVSFFFFQSFTSDLLDLLPAFFPRATIVNFLKK